VGAGRVAESKIESLLAAGAEVRVVAPKATRAVAHWASGSRISWESREFKPADLDGAALVIAATSSPEAHERIYEEARRRGIWCNVVDDPAHCDFYYPSVVRRGSLQIAVSTNGRSPALAQRLRKEFEAQFGPEYEAWVGRLGEAREKLFEKEMDPEKRRRLLHRMAAPSAFRAFSNGNGKNGRSAKS
jgi:precorrin-2 dehydrogenase